MECLLIYLLTITSTVLFVFYSKYQFLDFRRIGKLGRWHTYGALMRMMVILTPYILLQITDLKHAWKDFLLAGVINLIIWDILLNLIAIKTSAFYNGEYSEIDIKLGNIKWIILFVLLITAILIRVL